MICDRRKASDRALGCATGEKAAAKREVIDVVACCQR